MQIIILAIGRVRNDPIKQVYKNYINRLPWPCEVRELQNPATSTDGQQKQKEAKLLINALPQNSFSIALDKQGQILSSEAFAKKIGSSLVALMATEKLSLKKRILFCHLDLWFGLTFWCERC